jgi:hypothetical protein
MSLLTWLLDDKIDKNTQLLIDKAYCEGAKNEREAILGILDRLIPNFVKVNTSVARQARAEILERAGKSEDNDKQFQQL